jgi:hypothetical protein
MQNTVKISCNLSTSDSSVPLGMEIWLDDQEIFNQAWITESVSFCYHMPDTDTDTEHELRFVMKNKLSEHTTIDAEGNIVKDAYVTVNDLTFDDVALEQLVAKLAVYTHDFNGTQPIIQDEFFGAMGCNGTVSLKFRTPVYLWLLENL